MTSFYCVKCFFASLNKNLINKNIKTNLHNFNLYCVLCVRVGKY